MDLEHLARRMREYGEQIEVNANETAIGTALAIDQALVLATPVDTGRARANWQASTSAPITQANDDTDKQGGATISRNAARIRQRLGGQDIFITNNVPYIEQLNQGSSAQAPANFVEQAIQAGLQVLRNARLLR